MMGETNNCSDVLPEFCNQIKDHVKGSLNENPFCLNDLHAEETKRVLQVSSVPEKLHDDTDSKSEPISRHHRSSILFCAKELSTSIITSESTRIISSISIALVVVLSFIDRPLIGINIVNSKSIVAMRPLYMLLVTEFTILIAYLVVERRRRAEDFDEYRRVVNEGGISWERAVRVLERGLVAHQMIRALFIDFSVYVVIVVCVLSLV
ncbi:hypothetical protein RND81_09G118400 [Saponaria officinalis]|uniref:Uncharacterized protein n=1 Tax=Saponaria officinalis TaxID=3572 RepID=A0AAW1IKZ2_SAPOF